MSVISLASNKVARTIDLAPYRKAPVGSNPSALALAPDGSTLYVANAGADDVDVIRLAGGHDAGRGMTARDAIVGRIPTGVEVSNDGRSIFVANAKGLGAGPNPNGPNPYTDDQRRNTGAFAAQYIGSMIKGTMSVVPTPDVSTLARYTAQVARTTTTATPGQLASRGVPRPTQLSRAGRVTRARSST